MPFVKPEVVDKLVVDFRVRSPDILLPTYKGLGGHPGIYAARLRDDFFMHGDTSGAKEILLRHRAKTSRLAVHDTDVCFDIDTEADVKISMDTGARWARVEAEAEARESTEQCCQPAPGRRARSAHSTAGRGPTATPDPYGQIGWMEMLFCWRKRPR